MKKLIALLLVLAGLSAFGCLAAGRPTPAIAGAKAASAYGAEEDPSDAEDAYAGPILAGGNALAAVSSESKQTSLYVSSASVRSAGTAILIGRNGEEVLSFVPEVEYQNVLISSSKLAAGVAYEAYLGGSGTAVVAAR